MHKLLSSLGTLLLVACLFPCQAQSGLPEVKTLLTRLEPEMASFTHYPNEWCDYFYVYGDDGYEVNMWAKLFGMTVEDAILRWGERYDVHSDDLNSTWSFLTPGSYYQVLNVPFDAAGHPFPLHGFSFRTPSKGDNGRSTISIKTSMITDSSAYIVSTPNEATAVYYNGLVSADSYHRLGLDSICQLLKENTAQYNKDQWGRLILNSGTRYCAIAFGQNQKGVFGDTTQVWFTTKGKKTTMEPDSASILFYPGTIRNYRIPPEQWHNYTVRVITVDASRIAQTFLLDEGNIITATLPVSDYYVEIMRNSDGKTVKRKLLSIRKKDMDTLRLKEDDGFVWQRLRRDYNFAIGDANGQTMTPYIFTALSYFNGLFFGTTHADNQLYGVILSQNGRFVIDANRHYDKIILDTISSRFYVAKQGQYGICDMTGRVIVEPVYEEILDTDTYYMVLQNNHWGCIEKDGTIVFPPRYDNFEKMENGYRIFLDGQEGWLDLSGKEHWSEK